MPTQAFQDFVRGRSRIATIIWAVLVASVATYGIVLFYLVGQSMGSEPTPPEGIRTLSMALGALGLAIGAASIIMPRMMLSRERLRERLPKKPLEHIVVEGEGGAVTMISLKGMTPAESRAARVVYDVSVVPHVIAMALAESVALFGLVLGIMARETTIAMPFLIASGTLMIMRMPRVEATAEMLREEAERTQAPESEPS